MQVPNTNANYNPLESKATPFFFVCSQFFFIFLRTQPKTQRNPISLSVLLPPFYNTAALRLFVITAKIETKNSKPRTRKEDRKFQTKFYTTVNNNSPQIRTCDSSPHFSNIPHQFKKRWLLENALELQVFGVQWLEMKGMRRRGR